MIAHKKTPNFIQKIFKIEVFAQFSVFEKYHSQFQRNSFHFELAKESKLSFLLNKMNI